MTRKGESPFGVQGGKPGTKAYNKKHAAYVKLWRAGGRDKYVGPGRRASELPERYRPKKRKGGRKK